MLKLAALESNKNQDLEKKEGRIDDLLRVSVRSGVKLFRKTGNGFSANILTTLNNQCFSVLPWNYVNEKLKSVLIFFFLKT